MDLIDRQVAIDAVKAMEDKSGKGEIAGFYNVILERVIDKLNDLPSAQPEYEPVKAEDFAKTMSENTLYGFITWHGEALELMERQGFVICKKTL